MADLTSVGVTSGVPSSGTGTVATINQLIAVGAPISNGSTVTPITAAITGNASAVTSTMSALVTTLSPNSSVRTVTLSSNPTVIPSSAFQVTLTSNTVQLSSNPTVIPSSVSTVTLSSNPTVILSSNPTITSLSSGVVSIMGGVSGANLATVVAGSSAVTSTMAALVVALSTLGPLQANVTGSSQVLIIGGSAQQNTAFVLSGSSLVTSTMAALVVAISSNGAGVIGTGTPTVPSSQYISAVTVGDLLSGAANSSASNPVAIGGVYNSSLLTVVTSGQRVQAWYDNLGRQITISSLRSLKGTQVTSLSSTTIETNITPASSGGNKLDIYGLIVANGSTTQTQTVTIKDSSGGTIRSALVVPALDTRGFMLTVDSAWVQSASSQAWTATNSNSSGLVTITAMYVTNI